MVFSKKRKTGVGQFLDLDAEEDGGESEVENDFDSDDEDNKNESLLDKRTAVFDALEDEQGWYRDALCDYITSRYVLGSSEGIHPLAQSRSVTPGVSAGPSNLKPSGSEGSSLRESRVSPTDTRSYPCLPQNTMKTLFQEHSMYSDARFNAARLRTPLPAHARHLLLGADLSLLPPRSQILSEKSYLSEDHIGHLEWVSIRLGTYRGDIGLAIGMEKGVEEQQRDKEELEQRNEKAF
ncbi:hypothetical protein V5O48_016688 [Marasmius crinis-equi]|uniref:Uncharacterized protein n=1 Tax=Marasmius crinis-equi TaxID=585013 RepID=A0ABR3EQZ8_9AGAR